MLQELSSKMKKGKDIIRRFADHGNNIFSALFVKHLDSRSIRTQPRDDDLENRDKDIKK